MRICIHRGANEIGGTCIEVESRGQRIVLDIGLPLDVSGPEAVELPPVAGFTEPDPSLLGVVISHPHQDHYGLARHLPEDTLFLIGKAAKHLLETAAKFSAAGVALNNTMPLRHHAPIKLGPFTITPYLVDHSGYDSYAVLVEADSRRLFYTGDLRAHGRKAKLFEQLVRYPPQNVDVLLMEGTTIGREGGDEFPTEHALEARFVEAFQQTAGMPLVWCAGQNIDRIVTIFKACRRAKRQLIIDPYIAHILRATGNANIPQACWNGVRVFVPEWQRRQIKKTGAFELVKVFQRERIFTEALADEAGRSVLLFRPSMMQDLERAGCLDGANLVYSLWSGYLERDEMKPLLAWLDRWGIPLEHIHTSGHASVKDLRRLASAIEARQVVPVHTDTPDFFATHFGDVVRFEDGETWEV